jgi:hypothetical protein
MMKKPQQVVEAIKSKMNENEYIHDTAHMSIDVKTIGFLFWQRTEIHVTGRVDTQREKQQIDKILEAESAGYTIVNNLRVHMR